MKKHKGSIVEDIIFPLLCIVGICVFVIAILNVVSLAIFKADVKGVARDYILQMETEGYLTSAGATTLRQEFTDYGVTDIDLTGTTMSQVEYGQDIYLQIRYDIPVQVLNSSSEGILGFFFEGAQVSDVIRMKSTAKY